MGETNIGTAQREYFKRPPDERFESVQALIDHASHVKARSAERTMRLADLAVVPQGEARVVLQSPKGTAAFTHWAFGQFCGTVKAGSADKLRDLPPAIAADVLNYRLRTAAVAGPDGKAPDAKLLLQMPNGQPAPVVRAITSGKYGRAWDADVYRHVQQTIMTDAAWGLPPIWGGGTGGAYAGDRDSFLIVTNGGSIVTDPSLHGRSDGTMFRGLLIRNSEVGACSVTIDQILFRYICGNLMLWGAFVDQTFKRRHVGERTLQATIAEISRVAYRWTESSPARDQAIVQALIDHELADTRDAVITELRKIGATEETAKAAYAACEQHEAASPRSFWGIAQGLTRVSQEAEYQDGRYELDQIALAVMKRARSLVAA